MVEATQAAPQGDAPAPEKGTPEYNQMMAERYDNQSAFDPSVDKNKQDFKAPKGETPPMPENGLEVYYNKETGQYDWESHAKEIMFNQNGRNPNEAPQDPAKTSEKPSESSELWDTLDSELAEKGELSDTSMEQLRSMGIPENIISTYLEGVKALGDRGRLQAESFVGGSQNLNGLLDWAGSNLTKQEIDTYNEMLAEPTKWQVALEALQSKMNAANPTNREPKGPLMGDAPSSGISPFPSQKQMVEAMQDPRYKDDPQYRSMVRQRVAVSEFM